MTHLYRQNRAWAPLPDSDREQQQQSPLSAEVPQYTDVTHERDEVTPSGKSSLGGEDERRATQTHGHGSESYELSDLLRSNLDPPPGVLHRVSRRSGYAALPPSTKLVSEQIEEQGGPISVVDRGHKREFFSGWRVGVSTATLSTSVVLLLNIVLLAWAASHSHSWQLGIGTLYEGRCAVTKSWSMWLHLGINALGTILLAGSNYTMQVACSPTRQELDVAHKKGVWLDIGVPSVRNLRHISFKKVVVWVLLGLSSVPLHLLYNSAVSHTLGANEYNVFVVSDSFRTGSPYNESMREGGDTYALTVKIKQTNIEYLQTAALGTQPGNLERLENADCISKYSNLLMTGRANLLAVTTRSNLKGGSVEAFASYTGAATTEGGGTPLTWMCGGSPSDYDARCDIPTMTKNAQSWRVFGEPIDYCLSEITTDRCTLQFSRTIMIVVIVCNAMKLCCMLYTLRHYKDFPLSTLGDAVGSLLTEPDLTTAGACLMSKLDVKNMALRPKTPLVYEAPLRRWYQAASLRRWLSCLALCVAALVITGVLLGLGLAGLYQARYPRDIKSLWNLGFGQVSAVSLVRISKEDSTPGSVLSYTLLANAPQLILSFLYLLYNGVCTCMLLASEASDFAHQRKALRVTSPKGEQRSTYYLQLPYRYAIPLVFASGLLHWLVSQSIFLAQIEFYGPEGQPALGRPRTTCGYSCIAIIFVIIAGFLMLLALILLGQRKLKLGVPLAANCSLAISAACHRPAWDEDAALLPVKWGAVGDELTQGEVGHCAFSSGEVKTPVRGLRYAGVSCDAMTRRWSLKDVL